MIFRFYTYFFLSLQYLNQYQYFIHCECPNDVPLPPWEPTSWYPPHSALPCDTILLARAITALQRCHNRDRLYRETDYIFGDSLCSRPKRAPEDVVKRELHTRKHWRRQREIHPNRHAYRYINPTGMYRYRNLLTRDRMKRVGNEYIIFLSRPQFSPLKKGRKNSRECYSKFLATGTSRHHYLQEHVFFCDDVIWSEFECNCLFWDRFNDSSCLIFRKETPKIVAKFIEFNNPTLGKGIWTVYSRLSQEKLGFRTQWQLPWISKRSRWVWELCSCPSHTKCEWDIYYPLRSRLWKQTQSAADIG